jgi:accessory gene regulator B
MEKLIQKLANKISVELNFDEDKRAVVAYGLIALIQLILFVFFITFIGFFLGIALEALTMLFSVSLLRRFSGGAHAGSFEVCTVSGIFFCLLLPFLAKLFAIPYLNIYSFVILLIIVFLLATYILYKYAPVDHPNKPIKSEKKKRRMRKNSFITLFIFFIISIVLVFFGSYCSLLNRLLFSIFLGILWQIFTLTSSGAKSLKLLDNFFNKVNFLTRR